MAAVQQQARADSDRAADREAARLAALHEYGLHEYGLLDHPVEDELEAVVRIAALVAGVPTATLNLIDEHRQCQLTTVGFDGADSPVADSMCAVRFREGRTVHVPDASVHPDYADNPWVSGRLAAVRFYASVPLLTPDGHPLGTLCVFDMQPRMLDDAQVARLQDLARILVALFQRRREVRETAALAVALQEQRDALQTAHADLARSHEELARSNEDLEQFAAVAGHDLRSPLGVIDGYLELLLDVHGTVLPEQAHRWVGAARGASGRMQSLITALLAHAQAGGRTYDEQRVELGDVFRDVVLDLRGEIERADAVVTAAVLPAVAADPVLLRQMLQNLIGNALKYRHPERRCRITVTTTRRRDSGQDRGQDSGQDSGQDHAEDHADGRVGDRSGDRARDRVEVSVEDNGVGVPAEHRERVLGMFTTVDPAARTGHGIGLATCARIAQRHGTQLQLHPAPGGGLTVTFTLPAAVPAPATAPEEPPTVRLDPAVLGDPARLAAVAGLPLHSADLHVLDLRAGDLRGADVHVVDPQARELRAALDGVAARVAAALDVPIALVNLVADTQVLLAGIHGVPAEHPAARAGVVAVEDAFCPYTVSTGAPYVIEDATTHPAHADSALVRHGGLASYAGVPLATATGRVLGAVCAHTYTPRGYTSRDLQVLEDAADEALHLLTRHYALSAP